MKSETLFALSWKTLSLYSPVMVKLGVMVSGARRGAPSTAVGGRPGLPGGNVSCAHAGVPSTHTAKSPNQAARTPGRVTFAVVARSLADVQRFFAVQPLDR